MADKDCPVLLCADDYAMSAGISEAICGLLDAGRLSATSCMTLCAGWREQAGWLKRLGRPVDIGLHLTLTDYPPLGPMPATAPEGRLPPLPALMRQALLWRLNAAEIAAELARQLDAFEAAFGAAPAFIDGHQHVHQLPIVREAVLAALRGRLGGQAYARSGSDSPAAILARGVAVPKALLIGGLGLRFRGALVDRGIPTNRHFTGIYDFPGRTRYADLFGRFLRGLRPGTLIMCHPGRPDPALPDDPIAGRRREELEFFRGDAFMTALDRARARVAPFAETVGPI